MNENNAENNTFDNNQASAAAPETAKIVEKNGEFNILKEVWEWFYTIFFALVIALTIKMFIVDIVRVDGSSMYPTLVNNERLFITKIGYKPHQGDIIILDSNYKNRHEFYDRYEEETGIELNNFKKFVMYLKYSEPNKTDPKFKRKYYVKRIVGMPGDVVDIKDGKVYINDEVLEEPYYDGITEKIDPRMEFPFTVSDKCVFVMGDNRGGSKDSRSADLGEVPYGAIAGRAVVRLWPFDAIGVLK